jgi:hypothetical protein
MKTNKLLLITGLVTFGLYSNAQLTLTKAGQEPVAGDVNIRQEYDTLGALPKSSGANQNWNFSGLLVTTFTSNSNYVSASVVPSSSLFPGTTLVEDLGGGSYNYWKSTSTPTTQFEFLGNYDVNPPASGFRFTTPEKLVMWPMAPGATFTNAFSGNFLGTGLSGNVNGTSTVTSSGTGTITLPGGATYANVIQLKTLQRVVSSITILGTSISYTDQVTNYRYYHASQKFPLLTAEYYISKDGTTIDTSLTIQLNKNITVGLKDVFVKENLNVYPNPAKNIVNIDLTNKNGEECRVNLFSTTGQLMKEINLGKELKIEQKINVSDLPKGIYLMTTTLGDATIQQKLIIE